MKFLILLFSLNCLADTPKEEVKPKIIYKTKIVYKERIVYKDRIVYKEKQPEIKTITKEVPVNRFFTNTRIVEKIVKVKEEQKLNIFSIGYVNSENNLVKIEEPTKTIYKNERFHNVGLKYQRFLNDRYVIGGEYDLNENFGLFVGVAF